MIDNFLFFIDIYAETTAFVEYVVFVIGAVVNFARKATTSGNDQLALRFKGIFISVTLSMIAWLL